MTWLRRKMWVEVGHWILVLCFFHLSRLACGGPALTVQVLFFNLWFHFCVSQTYGHVICRLWLWKASFSSQASTANSLHLQVLEQRSSLQLPLLVMGHVPSVKWHWKGDFRRTHSRFLLAELQGRSEGNWWGVGLVQPSVGMFGQPMCG